MRATVRAVLVAALLLSSCGSDQSSVSSTEPDPRAEAVVQWVLRNASEAGAQLDEACVRDLVNQLSDADVESLERAVADTAPDATEPSLSPEGEAIGDQLNGCLTPDGADGADGARADAATIDAAVAFVVAEEPTADEDCLRSNLGRLTNDELELLMEEGSASDNPQLDDVFLAVLVCIE